MTGTESVTLIGQQMPQHSHNLQATNSLANQQDPTGHLLAAEPSGLTALYSDAANQNATMNPQSVGVTGGSQPHNNIQPLLAVTFIIALVGIFPSRG
jgi:microcystin-dependent protein